MRERIRALSERSEFFLVVTLSFAYIVAASITVLSLRIRTFEITTGIAIQDTATEIAILLVVGWILHIRGWSVRRLTKPFSWASLLWGVLLFIAYYVVYAMTTLAVLAVHPAAANVPTIRVIPSAHWAVLIVFILVNSVLEEFLVTGYVVASLSKQGLALAITASTLIRFLYHLYQGPLASLSILPLGLLFAAVYWRWKTLWPLVVAHTIANLIAFAYAG